MPYVSVRNMDQDSPDVFGTYIILLARATKLIRKHGILKYNTKLQLDTTYTDSWRRIYTRRGRLTDNTAIHILARETERFPSC